jgi:hypothetical protein
LKSLDVLGFARDIALHGVVGPGLSSIAARVLPPFEFAVGFAVIIGFFRRTGLVLLLISLVIFMAATGWAWAHGNTEGCGCFGRFASRTPLSVIVEDAILAALAVTALVFARATARPGAARRAPVSPALPAAPPDSPPAPPSRPGRGLWRGGAVLAIGVAATAFTLASPRLPIDNLATALRPGVSLESLGLTSIAGNLGEGDRLLVILLLDEPDSQAAVPALNALALAPGVPPITGLTSASQDKRAEFFFAYAPSFELVDVPAADLRRLYRRAPRSFTVHNGAVMQVWTGIPAAQEFAK